MGKVELGICPGRILQETASDSIPEGYESAGTQGPNAIWVVADSTVEHWHRQLGMTPRKSYLGDVFGPDLSQPPPLTERKHDHHKVARDRIAAGEVILVRDALTLLEEACEERKM